MYALIAYFSLLSCLPLCGAEKSISYEDMTFHFQSGKASYTCGKCSIKPFTRASFLIRHAAHAHLRCHDCNEKYDSFQSIYHHIETNHLESNDYAPARKKLSDAIAEYNFYNNPKTKEIVKSKKKTTSKKRITSSIPRLIYQSNRDSHTNHSLPPVPHVESYLSNGDLISIKKDIILECLHQILNDDPRLPMLPTITTGFLSYCK